MFMSISKYGGFEWITSDEDMIHIRSQLLYETYVKKIYTNPRKTTK